MGADIVHKWLARDVERRGAMRRGKRGQGDEDEVVRRRGGQEDVQEDGDEHNEEASDAPRGTSTLGASSRRGRFGASASGAAD
eukprot:6188802-Pyramimonas_sp.AAC.1